VKIKNTAKIAKMWLTFGYQQMQEQATQPNHKFVIKTNNRLEEKKHLYTTILSIFLLIPILPIK